MVTVAVKLKDACSLKEKLWHSRHVFKSRDITLPTKVHIVKAIVFPVVMYEYECRIVKSAECRRIDAFELWCWRRLLGAPWLARGSNLSVLKEINPQIFTGRTYTEAGAPILWPPDVKSQLAGEKKPEAGKDWRQEEKGMTENNMAGWHHQLDGHEFEQTLGNSEGHGSLECYSSLGYKELNMTEWLNINNSNHLHNF